MSNIVKHNLTIVPSFVKIGRHLAKVFTVVRHTRGFGTCVEQPAVVCQECTVVCQECTVHVRGTVCRRLSGMHHR